MKFIEPKFPKPIGRKRKGNYFKQLRIKKGLTQKEVSSIIDVSEKYVSMVENDKREIGDQKEQILCELYEVRPDAVEGAARLDSKGNVKLVRNYNLLLESIEKAYKNGDITQENLLKSIQNNYKPK